MIRTQFVRCIMAGFTLFFCYQGTLLAQTGASGSATLTLIDGGTTCNGQAVMVDVFVDVGGLTGNNGADVGLNAFILAFDLDETNVYASAATGTSPAMNWSMMTTLASVVDSSLSLTLVGWDPDPNAPNLEYHLATIILSGTGGTSVTLTPNLNLSSLGTRVADGDGPGSVDLQSAGPITVTLPATLTLDLLEATPLWQENTMLYDLVNPVGAIDVLDMVQVVNCGGS